MNQYAVPFVPSPPKVTRILLPESCADKKVILYKVRLKRDEPWLGGALTVPYNLNIEEAQIDGMSVLKHIHLRLTGLLEMKYGAWVWQESDQMQSTCYIEEIPEIEWTRQQEHAWRRFLRHDPR